MTPKLFLPSSFLLPGVAPLIQAVGWSLSSTFEIPNQLFLPPTNYGTWDLERELSSPVHELEGASQVMLVVENPAANAGYARDSGLTSGSGRPPGGGLGNPL